MSRLFARATSVAMAAMLAIACGPAEKTSSNDNSGKSTRHYNTIYEMIEGQPGIIGTGSNIRVRGASSLVGGAAPLYIIDGTVGGSIATLTPEDVHEIEILKDSDTAIYGMKGSGGVIKITTKAAYEAKQAEKAARQAERAAKKAAKNK